MVRGSEDCMPGKRDLLCNIACQFQLFGFVNMQEYKVMGFSNCLDDAVLNSTYTKNNNTPQDLSKNLSTVSIRHELIC